MDRELYRNGEHYFDPTAGEALTNVMSEEWKRRNRRYCPVVYISSRYAGDIKANTLAAKRYARFAMENNAVPVAPHLMYPQFLNDDNPAERDLGMFFAKVLMGRCDEVWFFSDSGYSSGMLSEYSYALKRGYLIRRFTEDCREITQGKRNA